MLNFFKKTQVKRPVSVFLSLLMVFSLFVVNGKFAFADTVVRDVTIMNEGGYGKLMFEGQDETVTSYGYMFGDTVSLVSDPDDGYELSTLRIKSKNNNKSLTYSISGDRITFKMPRAEVEVYPVFEVATLDVDTSREVTGTEMYIKSNLNPAYVSYSQYKVVNAITTKQTIADASVFVAAGRNITIDEMYPESEEDGREYLIDALLNFQTSASEVIDVDPSSDYYVAFVNTMHDDYDAELKDWAFARNNVFGEALDGCILDADTGIAYIPKSYFDEDNMGNVQVQMLNTYNNASDLENHEIELIVNDPDNISILDSGIVTTGIYDNNLKFRLANDSETLADLSLADISVSINEVEMDEDSFTYDESTGVIAILGEPISIDTVTININKAGIITTALSKVADDFVAHAYSSWSALPEYNAGAWKLMSGTASTGSVTLNFPADYGWPGGFYTRTEAEDHTNGNVAYAGTPVDNFSSSNIWYKVYNGSVTAANIDDTLRTMFPFNVLVNKGREITVNGAKWQMCTTETYGTLKGDDTAVDGQVLLLQCTHVTNSINDEGVSGAHGFTWDATCQVRILYIDTTNHWLVFGVNTRKGWGQSGVGIYKVPYTLNDGYATMQKQSNNTSLSGVFSKAYNYEGIQYTVYETYNSSTNSFSNAVGVWEMDKYGNPGLVKNGSRTNESTMKLTIDKQYYLKETRTNNCFNLSSGYYAFKVGENDTISNPLHLYPVPNDTNRAKNTVVDTPKSITLTLEKQAENDYGYSMEGAEYTLYYSQDGGCPAYTLNDDGTQSIVSDPDVMKLATFVIGEDGKPKSITAETKTNGGYTFTPTVKSSDTYGKYLDIMPLGNYTILETKAPDGFKGSGKAIQFTTVTANGSANNIIANGAGGTTSFTLSSTPTLKLVSKEKAIGDPLRLTIVKGDTEGNKIENNTGLSLAGTVFKVSYYTDKTLTSSNVSSATPERVWYLTTKYDSKRKQYIADLSTDVDTTKSDELYYDSNGIVMIPIGTITIEEESAAPGFIKKNGMLVLGHVLADDSISGASLYNEENTALLGTAETSNESETYALYAENEIKRYDFNFTKKLFGEDDTNLSNISFNLSLLNEEGTAVETHTLTTTDDGTFDSSTAPDDFWFYGTGDESAWDASTKDLTKGRLPYGKYKLVEVNNENNENYQVKAPIYFEFTKNDANKKNLDLGDVYNAPFPVVHTTEVDVDTNTHFTFNDGSATIKDTVTITNLHAGSSSDKYGIKGVLMDITNGNAVPVTDASGNIVSSYVNLDFTDITKLDNVDGDAYDKYVKKHTIDMNFEFDYDMDAYAGHTFVVYEYLYAGNVNSGLTNNDFNENNELANTEGIMTDKSGEYICHADPTDADQTGYIPKISTTATDSVTGTHVSAVREKTTINDAVSYAGLINGEKYKLYGKLIDKDTGDTVAEASKEFEASTSKKTTVVFEDVNTLEMAGHTFVVYETLYYVKDGTEIKIAEHTDINDKKQTIYIPNISTTALDSETLSHVSLADGPVEITDEVAYGNLVKGKYTVKGKMILKDDNGGSVIATSEEPLENSSTSGTITLSFNIDEAKDYEGKTVVIFEEIYNEDGELIAAHTEYDDEGQSVHFPKAETTAVNAETASKLVKAGDKVFVKDTIAYENLDLNTDYSVTSYLVNKETGTPIYDSSTNEMVTGYLVNESGEKVETFNTGNKRNGTVNVIFEFSAASLGGYKATAFEFIIDANGNTVAKHDDKDSADQTISIVGGHTTAMGVANTKNINADKDQTVTDTVAYFGLLPNKEYTLTGYMMVKPEEEEAGRFVTFISVSEVYAGEELTGSSVSVKYSDGTAVTEGSNSAETQDTESTETDTDVTTTTKTTEYIINLDENGEPDGTVTIKHFTDEIEDEEGTQTVNAEESEEVKALIDKYNNATDRELVQTEKVTKKLANGDIYHENINTYSDGTEEIGSWVDIADVRTETEETETSELIIKEDGMELEALDVSMGHVLIDADGNMVTNTVTFTTPAAEEGEDYVDGTVDMTFTFNASLLAGETIVAFESVYYNNNIVFVHAEINDLPQTVYIPELGTTVEDDETESHMSCADESVTLTDTIWFKNLIAGQKYVFRGYLMDKETGEVMKDADGKDIAAEQEFIPEGEAGTLVKEGTVDVKFTFNGTNLADKTGVVFEYAYLIDTEDNEVEIGKHTKIDEKDQTIYFPSGHTTAKTSEGIKRTLAKKDVTIVDTVYYSNLIPEKEYTVTGVLMDKETNSKLLVDGKEVTSTIKFTAPAAKEGEDTVSGEVEVTFTFSAVSLEGKSVVVFETVKYLDKDVIVHADINDKDQTIDVPKVGTKATDKADGDKTVNPYKNATVVDTISYTNLEIGKTYKVTGTLMNAKTGEALVIDGKAVSVTKEFVAEKENGTWEMGITFDASKVAAGKYVVFEDVYEDDILVAVHNDLNDEGQTVEIPDTPQTGDANILMILFVIAFIAAFTLLAVSFVTKRRRMI